MCRLLVNICKRKNRSVSNYFEMIKIVPEDEAFYLYGNICTFQNRKYVFNCNTTFIKYIIKSMRGRK